jgi:hypothetical protein
MIEGVFRIFYLICDSENALRLKVISENMLGQATRFG